MCSSFYLRIKLFYLAVFFTIMSNGYAALCTINQDASSGEWHYSARTNPADLCEYGYQSDTSYFLQSDGSIGTGYNSEWSCAGNLDRMAVKSDKLSGGKCGAADKNGVKNWDVCYICCTYGKNCPSID